MASETLQPAGGPPPPLPAERLCCRCDPTSLGFATTAELAAAPQLIGQQRALSALEFGASIRQPGFNVFAHGARGTGKHTAIAERLQARAAAEPAPLDWLYVNNFAENHRPRAIGLPPGEASRFAKAMEELVDDLRAAIPALFEAEEYQNRRGAIDEEAKNSQEQAFEALQERAQAQSVAILRTPMGFALAPQRGGQVIKPEVFNALPEAERREIERSIQELQKELEHILQQLPALEKTRRQKIRELTAEMAELAVAAAMGEIKRQFAGSAELTAYLEEVHKDLVAHVDMFLEAAQAEAQMAVGSPDRRDARLRRYGVNVVVANEAAGDGATAGAPVVFEPHPTMANLVGRIEHIAQMGALVTDFMLIKPGALHRANGGYLVLDAVRVLTEPFAWDALKRCLANGAITIGSPAEQLSLVSTISLQPDPVPLSVKVVLIGDPIIYYLLVNLDPDFARLFKVEADFDDRADRDEATVALYARLIAGIAATRRLRPLAAGAVARVIDELSRWSEDAEKLSLRVGPLTDLLCEADFWAGDAGAEVVAAEHVDKAIAQSIYRADRLRARSQEMIARGTVLIDTEGAVVGQVNGLSVLSLGSFSFGRPTRITARVRMGSGKVVDIEREVELGGPLHSKGVLILSSFLASRYALDAPISLWASLVFEQSYGGVDGDSASSAELYALLSALGEVAIRQHFAVTGSVNQLGQVQAIGGVNEKIEGFFDTCLQRGLTGDQGVLIPAANVKNLMLRHDVVAAARAGRFHIHPVGTVDQGIELLTGVAAGERGTDGRFAGGTVNGRVEAKLNAFAATRRRFGVAGQGEEPEAAGEGA